MESKKRLTNHSYSPITFNHSGLTAKKNQQKILKLISRIIDSGVFLNGRQTSKLEKNILNFLGRGYVVTTASGHDSLKISFSSLNLTKNDEIIFPVNVYPTAFPVCLSGAKPIPVDVDENGQMDPKTLKQKINQNTRVIVLVHLYGLVGKIDEITELIKGKNIFLVEDCAQAFGSSYNGKPVGTFGNISCFSFYPTKNISTLGDGGALWTKHKKLYNFFLKAKSYGETQRYFSEILAGHSRIPEIQAGIINVFLKQKKNDFTRRKEIAKYYKRQLAEISLNGYIRVLDSDIKSDHIPHLFVIEAQERDHLREHLKRRNIPTLIHYPYPIHLLPSFRFLGNKLGDFPIAEKLSRGIISLPFHQYLTYKSVDYIVKAIKEFYT